MGLKKYHSVITPNNSPHWEAKMKVMEPLYSLTNYQFCELATYYEHGCPCDEAHESKHIKLSCCNIRYHVPCFLKQLHGREEKEYFGNPFSCGFCQQAISQKVLLCDWKEGREYVTEKLDRSIHGSRRTNPNKSRSILSECRRQMAIRIDPSFDWSKKWEERPELRQVIRNVDDGTVETPPLQNNVNPENQNNSEDISGDQNGQRLSTPTQSNNASSRNTNRSTHGRSIATLPSRSNNAANTANTSTAQRGLRRRRTNDNSTAESNENNRRQRRMRSHHSIGASGVIDETRNG